MIESMEIEPIYDDPNEYMKKMKGSLSIDEIINIFSFLDYKEILKFSLICKQFQIASNSNYLWKQIYQINHAIDIPEGNGKEIYFKKQRLDRNWFFNEPKTGNPLQT